MGRGASMKSLAWWPKAPLLVEAFCHRWGVDASVLAPLHEEAFSWGSRGEVTGELSVPPIEVGGLAGYHKFCVTPVCTLIACGRMWSKTPTSVCQSIS